MGKLQNCKIFVSRSYKTFCDFTERKISRTITLRQHNSFSPGSFGTQCYAFLSCCSLFFTGLESCILCKCNSAVLQAAPLYSSQQIFFSPEYYMKIIQASLLVWPAGFVCRHQVLKRKLINCSTVWLDNSMCFGNVLLQPALPNHIICYIIYC